MSDVVYFVASSLDGYIADRTGSLEWLTSRENQPAELAPRFMSSVGVQVMGSSTYEWLLRSEDLVSHPEKWSEFFGSMRTIVFSTRALPIPVGAEVEFLSGSPDSHMPYIRACAEGRDIWLVGGAKLAAQFMALGLLDRLEITYAPVLLGAGIPLLDYVATSNSWSVTETMTLGDFVHVRLRRA